MPFVPGRTGWRGGSGAESLGGGRGLAEALSEEGAAPQPGGRREETRSNHLGPFSCQHRLPQIEERTDWDDNS